MITHSLAQIRARKCQSRVVARFRSTGACGVIGGVKLIVGIPSLGLR